MAVFMKLQVYPPLTVRDVDDGTERRVDEEWAEKHLFWPARLRWPACTGEPSEDACVCMTPRTRILITAHYGSR